MRESKGELMSNSGKGRAELRAKIRWADQEGNKMEEYKFGRLVLAAIGEGLREREETCLNVNVQEERRGIRQKNVYYCDV